MHYHDYYYVWVPLFLLLLRCLGLVWWLMFIVVAIASTTQAVTNGIIIDHSPFFSPTCHFYR
jgi:hypothetical protein